jgi:1,4-alpha-glucan branching enzyme
MMFTASWSPIGLSSGACHICSRTTKLYDRTKEEISPNGRARVPEEIWPGKVYSWFSKKRSTLGGALVLTSPGIPMIFEGQELLEDRWFQDNVPIDWSRVEDEHGILRMYRD